MVAQGSQHACTCSCRFCGRLCSSFFLACQHGREVALKSFDPFDSCSALSQRCITGFAQAKKIHVLRRPAPLPRDVPALIKFNGFHQQCKTPHFHINVFGGWQTDQKGTRSVKCKRNFIETVSIFKTWMNQSLAEISFHEELAKNFDTNKIEIRLTARQTMTR